MELPSNPRAHEPAISVVSVVWNARSTLESFLDSIHEQTLPALEIILVDNGSTDGSREYLRTRDDVRLIESDVNLGYGAGMNRGIRDATGEAILLTNNDLRFEHDAFEKLIEEITRDEGYGAVGPIVKVPPEPGEVCPLLKGDPGLYYGWSFFSGFMARWPRSRWVNWNLEFEPQHALEDQAWLHGCCGLYRREALDAVGGFDERFFLYFEDCDLGRRLRNAGWRLRLAHDAEVMHLEGRSTAGAGVRTRTHFMESWHAYHQSHSSRLFRCTAFGVVLAALGVQAGVQLAKRVLGRQHDGDAISAYLRAHWRCFGSSRRPRRPHELESREVSSADRTKRDQAAVPTAR